MLANRPLVLGPGMGAGGRYQACPCSVKVVSWFFLSCGYMVPEQDMERSAHSKWADWGPELRGRGRVLKSCDEQGGTDGV